MDLDGGKMKAWDLRACPMVMDELRRITGKDGFDRGDLPVSGPMIIHEQIQRPWIDRWFREIWRVVARAAGVPTTIQNRDSRPGAATEADLAGAQKEKTQRLLGHSKGETTEIYIREEVEAHREMAKLRTKKREG